LPYSYVGLKKAVYNTFEELQLQIVKYPYGSYRKHRTYDEAWAYLETKKVHSFNRMSTIYYNKSNVSVNIQILIEKTLKIIYEVPSSFYVDISYKSYRRINNTIVIELDDQELDTFSVSDNCSALIIALQFINDFIPVNIFLKEDSLFFIAYHYSGTDSNFLRLQDIIKKRLGKVGWIRSDCQQLVKPIKSKERSSDKQRDWGYRGESDSRGFERV